GPPGVTDLCEHRVQTAGAHVVRGLHVYDGANDGDTVFVRLKWDEGPFTDPVDATYWAPGTSAVIDHNSVQLAPDDDIDEGTEVQLRVYDDEALTDPITDWYEVRA
ncbi:hypothetical protein ACWDPI_27380, partial [Streptomyces zhihengii]